MSAREDILARLRERRPDGEFPLPVLPSFPGIEGDLVAAFQQNLAAMGGQCVHLPDREALDPFLCARLGASRLIRTSTDELPGFARTDAVTDPRDLENVHTGIVRARFGVAETGSLFLSGRELQVNTIAYLAQHLVVLLDPAAIVPGIADAYLRDDFTSTNYVSLMTGPSATADIEGVMIRGAQGVRSLTVVFAKPIFTDPTRPADARQA
ncbi:LUD domain-containing protein [Acidisoma cellulosilytica]|uniref:LUD domain-containing protein n=1 Tax=Acidisoma cellulosilyticum TaxID=2802395 RepID=A0A963YXH2_9PROT|nr:LUD domain-containing protein [Acidisoma cellulosilyticum]MCB8878968.1 LUD domain-containing protein [Acidisoma cellulosilyticum]